MEISGRETLILAVAVLWLGAFISRHSSIVRKSYIPEAVLGGIVFSLLLSIVASRSEMNITFDMSLRDRLLIMFFASVGLSARLSDLVNGGRILLKLGAVLVVFLFIQNLVGALTAMAIGREPAFGLLGGSIALAGGHGTAISWGNFAADNGYPNVMEIGVAFATIGLICGGLVGGPIGNRLVRKFNLQVPQEIQANSEQQYSSSSSLSADAIINSLLMFAICAAVGEALNSWLQTGGILLPGFLTAMATGIVLANTAHWRGWAIDEKAISLLGDVSLKLFLAMSLMSMDLLNLVNYLGPILALMAAQIALVVVVACWVIFKIAGKNYDAAVISAGFTGIALGATPVGVANMQAITSRYGVSTSAFIVIPLLGAFFLDIANAVVIQTWIALVVT